LVAGSTPALGTQNRLKSHSVNDGLSHKRPSFFFYMVVSKTGDHHALHKLKGHAELQVLRRYLAQTDQDTQAAHMRGSPVDNHI